MADTFGQLTWEDVERVVQSRAANLVEIVLQFLKQPAAPEPREVPQGALTEKKIKERLDKWRAAIAESKKQGPSS